MANTATTIQSKVVEIQIPPSTSVMESETNMGILALQQNCNSAQYK
jgi:hypothetical protein